jgi:hypothetical protein
VEDASFLFILAEIAVGFAGFASIVAVLGQRSTRDHPRLDAFRLRGLLECSLLVVAFSLIPYVASRFWAGDATAWRLSSGLFFVAGTAVTAATRARYRSIAHIPTPMGMRLAVTALHLVPLPALLLTAIGIFGDRSGAIYLLCLLSYLLAGGIGFFRVMVSFIAGVRE